MSIATPTAARLPQDPFAAQSAMLRRHLTQCQAARGPWFAAASLAERVHGAMAPRFATTVALLALGLTLACGWL